MSNFIEFTYHHTCKKGQQAYVLNSAPFKSPVTKKNGKFKIPFLGEGYYLWEENIDAANRWGKNHYGNVYFIVEFVNVNISTDEMLDFLNRRDMKYFNELRQFYIDKRPKSKNWKLGVWIEFFKKLQKSDNTKFPYNVIRAEENLPDDNLNDKFKNKIYFTEGSHYYTYTSPLLMICVLDKAKLKFDSKSIL